MSTKVNTDATPEPVAVFKEVLSEETKALLEAAKLIIAENAAAKKKAAESETLAEAEKKRLADISEAHARERAHQKKLMEERVPIRLMKDNHDYKYDVEVNVNGMIYQIQRGVTVMVPRVVEDLLLQQERQDLLAAEKMEAARDKG